MKQCTICKKDLPTSLDEYGLVQAPLCQSCYYDFDVLLKGLFGFFRLVEIPAVIDHQMQFCDDISELGYCLEELLYELKDGETKPEEIVKRE